jgi:hypothetical protein
LSQHRIDYVTTSTAATHSFSVYAKAGGYNFILLRIGSNGGYVDLSNGSVVSGVTAGYTLTATPAGNGWYRVVLTGAAALNDTVRINVCQTAASDFTGNGTSGIYIYGAQLEAGSFATSYIPTVASTVTRSADVALMQGANFSSWYNQNEGTFTTQSDQYSITSPNNQWIFAATDGTSNNYIGSLTNPSSYRALVVAGGATQASIINGTVSTNTPFKSALAYKTNDFAATSGGAAVGTDTSGSVPALSALSIGAINSANYLNGHIRSIGYYNTRLPNTALVSLTAPNIIPSLSLDFTTQVFNVG